MSSSIVATTNGFVFPQYLPVDEADLYFYNRLNSDDWLNATLQEKTAALVQSTRAIDNLNFLGVKYDLKQKFEFPRWQPNPLSTEAFPEWYLGGYIFYNNVPPFPGPISHGPTTPPTIPQSILIACCENAIVLLSGLDLEVEIASLSTNSSVFANVRETYDRTLAVTHLRAGIASTIAWNYLRPWLADTNSFVTSRGN